MKAADVKNRPMREARHACVTAVSESLELLDIDWVERQTSEIIWHNIHWPLQREIENDER